MAAKAVQNFVTKAIALKKAPAKFTSSAPEGSRLIPSRTKDKEFQFRIDAGHFDKNTKKLNVVLQANSQATSPGVKDWIKKHSTHGQVATDAFDTAAKDPRAEYERMLEELKAKAEAAFKK